MSRHIHQTNAYLVLAFYQFVKIDDSQFEVLSMQKFCNQIDAKGRIYINESGINAQMSISQQDASSFFTWISQHPIFHQIDIKVHTYHEHVFPRMTIKYRKQLVALDCAVDLSQRGDYLSPQEWEQKLSRREEEILLLDVRNDYEWEVGHFEGAERPHMQHFREFPSSIESMKRRYDPSSVHVMMSCTGGIRCELYSSLMKQAGFRFVSQLKGGVIQYGLEIGNKHWKGHLFVFDDRLVIPLGDSSQVETIGTCCFCKGQTSLYYNCANMDCNQLFLCCLQCIKDMKGCCSLACQSQVCRPFNESHRPKPFSRLSYHQKLCLRKKATP